MEARELRIGNYLLDDYSGVVELVNINSEYNHIDYKKPSFKAVGRAELQYIEPIPLTEEWLIRFGFCSNPYNDTYLKGFGLDGLMTIHCDKTKGDLMLWEDRTSVTLKHVHQLQNLYFALIKEELILNAKTK